MLHESLLISRLGCSWEGSGSKNVGVDVRYSVANEGEMFDIMNILDGFLTEFC